jgi:ribosomal protein S18 acetylase RimI-like enzyme
MLNNAAVVSYRGEDTPGLPARAVPEFEPPAPVDRCLVGQMMQTRFLNKSDAAWVSRIVGERWNGPFVVTRGVVQDTRKLPGIIACDGDTAAGLLLFSRKGAAIEIVTLDALELRRGIGRLLLGALCAHAIETGAKRIWLITSNDNMGAVAFFTRCGFRLIQVWRDAITKARELKPQIPLAGEGGVPIRDELEFEKKMPNKRILRTQR